MAKKPDVSKLAGAVSKKESERLAKSRSQKRAQVIKENKELKETDKAFDSKYGVRPQDFDNLKDALPDYPNAISHNTVFHDNLRNHLTELAARANFVSQHDVGADKDEDKKLGINQAVQTRLQRAMPALQVHISNAMDQLNRSLAAHAHGVAGGASAFHTAHQAMVAATNHALDATRHLAQTDTIGVVGDNKVAFRHDLLGGKEIQDNLSGYESELRSSAVNKNVDLPAGVLKPVTTDTDIRSGFSPVGQAALRKQKLPATPDEAAQYEANQKELDRKLQLQKFRSAAETGRYTPTLGEMQRLERGERLKIGKPTPSPYAGVGGTGLRDIKSAVRMHFERNNPGKSFFTSGLNDPDFKSVAKNHWKQTFGNAPGPNFDEPTQSVAASYVKKHLPDVHASMLQLENHPAVKYAVKHNLGVFDNPETTLNKRLRLMGETELAGYAEKILKNKFETVDDDPTNEKVRAAKAKKIENPESAPSPTTTAPNVDTAIKEAASGINSAKESRNAVFSHARTGGAQ
jgi:hypothetical protein